MTQKWQKIFFGPKSEFLLSHRHWLQAWTDANGRLLQKLLPSPKTLIFKGPQEAWLSRFDIASYTSSKREYWTWKLLAAHLWVCWVLSCNSNFHGLEWLSKLSTWATSKQYSFSVTLLVRKDFVIFVTQRNFENYFDRSSILILDDLVCVF